MVLEVDPAVGHEDAGGQTEQHARQLPGEGVGQPEHGEQHEVARAEPHPLAVRARHPELLKLDGSRVQSECFRQYNIYPPACAWVLVL